ncbi:MAG: phosphatase PAP2 family protein [candidate division WOR-3 bacterium]|nr:phosphatase PAP2 family protein [candidate division WOR-3 bacterium]
MFVCLITLWADNIDQSLYNTIHNNWRSPTMDRVMEFTEYASSPMALATSNLAVFYFGGEKEQKVAKLAVTSWVSASITGVILKGIFNRQRPENQSTSRWNSSFPSGHTLSYFSLATVYSAKYHKLAIPLYSFGVIIGLSRIYLGEHYPSDVLAGAMLGVGFGYLTLKLEKELKKLPFFGVSQH